MKAARTLLMSACLLGFAGSIGILAARPESNSSQITPFSCDARRKAEALLKQRTVEEKRAVGSDRRYRDAWPLERKA